MVEFTCFCFPRVIFEESPQTKPNFFLKWQGHDHCFSTNIFLPPKIVMDFAPPPAFQKGDAAGGMARKGATFFWGPRRIATKTTTCLGVSVQIGWFFVCPTMVN